MTERTPTEPSSKDPSPYEPSRWARMQRRVLALAISVLLAMVAAEVLLRVFDVPPTPLEPLFVPSYQLSDNPELVYEYRPSYGGEGPAYDAAHAAIRTNSHGFRDRERPLEKPEGTVRILALGDSTTAGNGVERREDVYTARLEERLNARGADVRYEVLNLGVGGYHTRQEVECLREKGLAFDPDYVFVLFCINDWYTNADGGVQESLERSRAHLDGASQGSLLGAVLQRSRLAFFVYHRVRNWLGSMGGTEFLRDDAKVEEGMRLFVQLSAENGVPAVVYILPAFKDPWVDYRHGEDHARLMEVAERVDGLEVVDLLPDFEAWGDDPAPIALDGLHANAEGHALVAEILERRVGERWLAPSSDE